MPSDEVKYSVLMVCLGNICRSPMAEAVFKHQLAKRPALAKRVQVDSAGTGAYHAGEEADERTIETCEKHSIPISCRARKVTQRDFDDFTHILAMDRNNLRTLQSAQPKSSTAIVRLFGEKVDGKVIDDPYYGSGMSGFERCYDQCVRYSEQLLDELEQ